ncbi:MAG: hypothetical protein GY913_09550 [Proteobacteria bacterium]|nr:hypothetical protein [Pseudomonadota bacterium]MCP4917156.1 hypothetical protein [Pseudomonadota bacterium]
MSVLTLVRPGPVAPPPPESMPIGRAALWLADQGVDVVFGTAELKMRAVPGGWQLAEEDPVAVHDRFPSWNHPREYAAATLGLEHLPRGNPIRFRDLCRDKVRFQREVPVDMPEIVIDSSDFDSALRSWGAGFLKPRYGGLGRGVRYVRPGDDLPSELEGAVLGQLEPAILQRAIAAPTGLAGLATRWLMQRSEDGSWVVAGGVCRTSETDPVTNVDRGAHVVPADTLDAHTGHRCREILEAVADWITDPEVCEVGLDLVIDPDGVPHLIEANSRPGGRLQALGPAYRDDHVRACARPLLYLCQLGPTRPGG